VFLSVFGACPSPRGSTEGQGAVFWARGALNEEDPLTSQTTVVSLFRLVNVALGGVHQVCKVGGVVVEGAFLCWISWGHRRWQPVASPGAGRAACRARTGEGCLAAKHLQERGIIPHVNVPCTCEYDVSFGWGIAHFSDMKAELVWFHQFDFFFLPPV